MFTLFYWRITFIL